MSHMTSYQCHGNEERENHPLLSILSYRKFLHLMSCTRSEISEFSASPWNSQEIKSCFFLFGLEAGCGDEHNCLMDNVGERSSIHADFQPIPFQPHASHLVSAVFDQESENLRDIFRIK